MHEQGIRLGTLLFHVNTSPLTYNSHIHIITLILFLNSAKRGMEAVSRVMRRLMVSQTGMPIIYAASEENIFIVFILKHEFGKNFNLQEEKCDVF